MIAQAAFLDTLRSLAPLDQFGAALVLILIFLGVWRGLWWQVIRLVGLVIAVLLARVFSPETSLWLAEIFPDLTPRMANGCAWVAVFLLALGAATLLGHLGQRMIEAMQLGFVNRMGGGLIGALTGLLVHLAVLVMVCQLAPERFVAKHVSGTYSERLIDAAGSRWRVVLGAEAADELERVFREATDYVAPDEEPNASTASDAPAVR